MFKQSIDSVINNFKDKIKNPFLGTYIFVWLIRNWDLAFTLFNFDKGISLEKKIETINTYFIENSFLSGVFINIALTFLILIITYILLNISRGIVNMFEKQLKPIVYKLTDKSSIVLKEDFEIIKSERNNLLSRIDDERTSKSKIEIEVKKLQDELDYKYEPEKNIAESKEGNKSYNVRLYNKLRDNEKLDNFIDVSSNILKRKEFSNSDKSLDILIDLGLIEIKSSSTKDNGYTYIIYSLTNTGYEVLKISNKN